MTCETRFVDSRDWLDVAKRVEIGPIEWSGERS